METYRMISLRSQVTKKLLNYFFINPQENLYVNELSARLQLDKRNLVKKIKELEREGILRHQMRGTLKLYSINKEYPLYGEYKKILMKTVGFEANLKKVLKEVKGISQAYIYGSYAKDVAEVHSDIDLLVVGNHSLILLQGRLSKLQKEIGREINAVNIDEKEFNKKIKDKDPFITGILAKENIRII